MAPGSSAGSQHALGTPALFQIRARETGEVSSLERARMLALVQTDAELGEILLRAFILRRRAS